MGNEQNENKTDNKDPSISLISESVDQVVEPKNKANTSVKVANRKKKPKRDAGAPKQPLSGYIRYFNKRREELKTEQPDKPFMKHTKIIAEEWNNMPFETKKPFLQAAEVDRLKYYELMIEYNQQKKMDGNLYNAPATKKTKRDESAPKQPLSGYIRFFNKRREELKIEFPDKSFSEQTKLIAEEWNTMDAETKKPYLRAAEADKKKYNQLLHEYNQQKNALPTENEISKLSEMGLQFRSENDIQIFTDDFLEHNKTVEQQLKILRKSNIDYEQQNSVLEKHIENLKYGIEKMELDNNELHDKFNILKNYHDQLKIYLIQAFSNLPIPGEPQGANKENIDKYLLDLQIMATSDSHNPALVNKAKDIIRKLDFKVNSLA